ncbi:hypothetical protein Btru_041086 [Bulinus truncatus]|nr:hypothetical protein Btru_041086 [Bulinus truncatus]
MVRCKVFNVYPEAKGVLSVNILQSRSIELSMNCTHEIISGKLVYYTSTCEGEISTTQLQYGDGEDVTVNIYPNITGEKSDKKYGYHITLNTYKNKSVLILENCPKIVVEGTEVRCVCRSKDTTSTTDYKQAWYDANNKIVNNGDQTLSYIATLRNKEHICRRRDDTVIENNPIYYNPVVIIKADNISCTSKTDSQYFLAECNVSRIYPQGICLFTSNEAELTNELWNDYTSSENIEYQNKLFYFTKCTLRVPNGILLHARYSIAVSVYPNITGTDSDVMYGVSRTIPFNMSEVSQSPHVNDGEQHSTFTAQLAPIVLCAAIVLFIAIMTSLVIIFRKIDLTELCVSRISTSVTIGSRGRKETLRPCSHLYESVEDLEATTRDDPGGTYVNSDVLTVNSYSSHCKSHNDYVIPNEVRQNCQTGDKDNESGVYILICA